MLKDNNQDKGTIHKESNQDKESGQKEFALNNDFEEAIRRGDIPDVNGRMIFQNLTLCAQFLRDFSDIDVLKNVQPEDLKDVTKRYQAYLGISFESDTVMKVHLREEDTSMYLIALLEHKSDVDYDVAMQLLRYMVCIWDDYAKKQEKTKAKGNLNPNNKGFQYPFILPIVYYEGSRPWAASLRFKDRVFMHEIFEEYIPDFKYKLVQNRSYSNEELLMNGDEISVFMMMNKVQSAEDLAKFIAEDKEKITNILQKAPLNVVKLLMNVFWNMCTRFNVPQEEKIEYSKLIQGGESMGILFEHMEKMDIQEERRKTKEQTERADRAEARAEEAEEKVVQAEERANQAEANLQQMKELLMKNMREMGKTEEEIKTLIAGVM